MACQQHRGHEVDVIALDRTSLPRSKAARITLIGEAKATDRPRGATELRRLEHIRDLLVAQGWNTADCAFAIFSRTGFERDLLLEAAPGRVVLIDLTTLYGV